MPRSVIKGTKAYNEGAQARKENKSYHLNPYMGKDTVESTRWLIGWTEQPIEAKRKKTFGKIYDQVESITKA